MVFAFSEQINYWSEYNVARFNPKTSSRLCYFLFLLDKPKVSILNPSNQFSKLGSVGSLVVKYLSWPPPLNLTWFKYENNQNVKLQSSENYYTIIETFAVIIDYCHDRKIHVDGYIGILHINEVTLKDFTNYTVLIQNEFGLEVFSMFLHDIRKYAGMFVLFHFLSNQYMYSQGFYTFIWPININK